MKQNKVASNLQQNYTEAEKAQARRNIGLADVAHSGDYNDLINKPVPINGQVQSDWNQTNEMMPDFIRNKPSIGDAVLTIRKNGSDVQTFSANSTTDKVANIEVPTKVSELQNDAGYITSSAIPAVNNGTLTIKRNGTTVQTFTANSSSNVTADISVPTQQQSNWTQSDSTAVDFIKNKRAFKTFVTSYDYPDCMHVRNPGANTNVLVYYPYEDRKKVLFVDGRVYNLKITTSGILPQDDTIETITARLFTVDTDGNRKYLCPAYTFKAGNSVQFDLHWEASNVLSVSEALLDECAPHIEFNCFLKANTDVTIYCNGLEWVLNENVAV